MTQPAAVIVLAAGQGTRMHSSLPKVLHPLAGLSMIGHAIRTASALEPRRVVAVVRHERDRVAREILRVNPDCLIADQDDIPGTGRAVECGMSVLDDDLLDPGATVIVTYGDVPLLTAETLRDLIKTHERAGGVVTVATMTLDDPTGYGRIVRDADSGAVREIVEQRDASPEQAAITEVNAGIYCFSATFLTSALGCVNTRNSQGEVYLTDVVAAASDSGRGAYAHKVNDKWQVQGSNDRIQLAQLGAELNRRICHSHMREGVTIKDPASTWIDIDVRIGADTTIYPATVIRGNTRIEAKCQIGPCATLDDTQVGEGSIIPSAWIKGTYIASGSVVRPFSVMGDKCSTNISAGPEPAQKGGNSE